MNENPETERKYGQLPPEEEQLELVQKMTERITGYGFLMNRQFDENKNDEAIKYATLMLEDMKTNLLTPVHYNELYQIVLSELSRLALNFQDEQIFTKRQVAELYETLQYTPSIVPRLYLLFTVAPAFIKAGHATANDVMRDLIEMARGVQHPTRALFLRHFLLHILKDVLPDEGNLTGGTLEDTLVFILENFKQMNVLWVRLEFSLNTKTAEERKVQRSQLKQLVGSNIQRIGSLRGLEVTHYKEIVMPSVIEQITACHESLAQYYIIESITQVFPAEYHFETLDQLFDVLIHLEDDVQTLTLVTSIIKRFHIFFTSEDADKQNAIGCVRSIAKHIDALLQAGQSFTLEDTLDMLATLLNFTLDADSGNTSNVDSILHFVENHIEGIYEDSRLDSVPVSRKLRFFLVTPLRQMKDASMVFELVFFPVLINRMRYTDRKLIAIEVCNCFSRTEALINSVDKLKSFFSIGQVLLQRPNDYEEDPDGIPISQHLQAVARCFHLIKCKNVDETYSLLTSVSSTVQALGPEVKEHLYLALGQAILRVAVLIENTQRCDTTVRMVLQHIYTLLSEQNEPPALPSFWIYLQAVLISDRCGTEAITTEFFVSAFRIWKDSMADSTIRYRMLISMIQTATSLKNLSATPYESITSELCSSVNGLLQKDQQAEVHLLCSHMFNVKRDIQPTEGEEDEDEAFQNPDKIKNCLVRALKVIASMMDPIEQLPWYYRVLAQAIYYIENGINLSVEWFKALTQKIDAEHEDHHQEIETKLSKQDKSFYVNLIRHKESVIHFE